MHLLDRILRCTARISVFAERCIPTSFVVQVPEGMDPVTTAPLMCAGVTVFNALRGTNEHAKQPALVAVVG